MLTMLGILATPPAAVVKRVVAVFPTPYPAPRRSLVSFSPTSFNDPLGALGDAKNLPTTPPAAPVFLMALSVDVFSRAKLLCASRRKFQESAGSLSMLA